VPTRNKILIVDDNATNIAILEEILSEEYDLASASTGETSLEIASAFQPDLILLDIMMPGINGYETCRRIRANTTLHHTKIIMVSAKAMLSERLQGYEAGADDYITKPFEEDELLAKVRVYMRLKSVEEVHQLKSDLLTLLSHETRTPLNGILAPVQLLLADTTMEDAERTILLDMVQQSAKRLQSLLQKVVTLSTMKARQWDFQWVSADLCELVRHAVYAVAAYAAERDVTIEQRLPDNAITQLDPEQMETVLRVILENAVRFSPLAGRVVVGVACDDVCCCVTVTDQGTGIDADFLPHVFEEFAHTDMAHHTTGHGLSLAIARQIVLAHNGTISVESTKGAGTVFTVLLPAAG
jgi:two-component system sensor histidine kinase/response regulator